MKVKGPYRSEAKAAVHELAADLHEAGLIGKRTMRRFDESCLTPVAPMPPPRIKAIRERERVSQSVFASYLNVTTSLVSQWERGEKNPSGPALKLLALVEKRGLSAVA
ncbi:MAG: DNA-binding transcriptional regulator [Bryobacteraceae bacterium]|nr:DNA-binding transcriptional regulator [Bryobacteraceae bacterium]